ncbi:MAG TPA: CopD family protein [Actinomycetota bacterium]|nr:CopD family protein [Actinomycetota bacterium]
MTGFEETFRSVALTLTRSISFASHAFLFGLVPVLLLVLRPAFSSLGSEDWKKGRRRVARRLEGMVQAALTATAVATLITLVLQFALVSETQGGEITSDPVFSVLETRFGQLYLLRFPLLVGLTVLLVGRVGEWSLTGAGDDGRPPGRVWWGGWVALSVGLLATSTLSGHAAVAPPIPVSILNDLLHLVFGSVWFAGIIVLALVVPDAWKGQERHEKVRLLAPSVARFSTVALVSITIVGLTGVLNSFLNLQELNDLVDTDYGRPILAKVLVYLGILAVGGINHYFVAGRLEAAAAAGKSDPAQSLFRKTIAVELVMALGVIGLTGYLTGAARTKDSAVPPSDSGVTARPTP